MTIIILMLQTQLIALFCLLLPITCYGNLAGLIIGNTAQQTIEVENSSLETDGHLGYGIGLLYAIPLSSNLTWEFGANYLQRIVGTHDGDTLVTMPGLQLPIGVRFRFASLALSGGLYYWREAGKVQATGTSGGTFSDLGYRNQHLGYYVGLVKGLNNNFFGEIRYASSVGNLSETEDVEASIIEYQLILGTIIKFGQGGGSSEGK